MEKRAAVVVAGTGDIRDVMVRPGVTAGDLARAANLTGDYWLTLTGGEPWLANTEEVFTKIQDGQKVYACKPVEVGR